MREREGSDVLGALEDPSSRGKDASKRSAEVGIPQERSHMRSYSIQQNVDAAVRLSQEPSDEDEYLQNLDARAGTPARQCKTERGTTPWKSPKDRDRTALRPFVVAAV